MKKILLIFFAFCCINTTLAQTLYKVTAKSSLNVRSHATINGHIIGKLHTNEQIEVLSINNEWAKIKYNGNTAYINTRYIKPINQESSKSQVNIKRKKNKIRTVDIERYLCYFEVENTNDTEWMTYVLLALSILLWLFRKIVRKEKKLNGGTYWLSYIIFLATMIFEILYIALNGKYTTWFCDPQMVGWILTIINFCLFAFIIFNQIVYYQELLVDTQYNLGYFDIRWGFYSWIGYFILGTIIVLLQSKPIFIMLSAVFLICQLVQLLQIFLKVVPKKGIVCACLVTIIYLVGAIATIWALLHFMVLFMIVILGITALLILGRSNSTTSQDSNYGVIIDEETKQKIQGYYSYNRKTFYSAGDTYEKDDFGRFIKQN